MNVVHKFKTIIKRGLNFLRPKKIIIANVSQLSINNLLETRNALITGGTSGIGYAIAKAYLQSGAKVIITGRTKDKLTKATQELSEFGDCTGIILDITNTDKLQETFNQLVLGNVKIDILVNNAGIAGGQISNATPEIFDSVIQTNLRGVFFLSQIVGKYMVENNIHGNILNISSASSIRPAACAYTISKWGIRGFTQGLARTLLPYGIVVNALAPGPVATPLLNKSNDIQDISLDQTPSGRFALPCEIANMAVILVSDFSRLIIGDTIFMTGGAGNIINNDVDYPF